MFTGLIADLGRVDALDHGDAGDRVGGHTGAGEDAGGDVGVTLQIGTRLAEHLCEGDSVAVNGVCLTATDVRDRSFRAQAMTETLRRSTLGELTVGVSVNLELALRADDRLGGHIVQGHVDGTGVVAEIRLDGPIGDRPARVLRIELDQGLDGSGRGLERYLVEKGSIAVDGVSLTVSALGGNAFEVSLIPETQERTNLGGLAVGDRVNLEADVLAKHVERLMEARV
jgi:riboflavin synthase